MVMVPKNEHMLCVGAFTEALEQAAQEGMLLDLRQEMRKLLLNAKEVMFCLGLTGEPRA